MTWFPSRHSDLDREFYERMRSWPHGDRLFVKRFREGRSETGYIVPATAPELHYDLFVSGALAKEGLSIDDLLGEGWEVD